MVKNWRSELSSRLSAAIVSSMPEAKQAKSGKIDYWYVEKGGERYAIALEPGKYSDTPEFRLSLFRYPSDDEYAVTSPSARTWPYDLDWQDTKHIAGLADETKQLKDKNSRIHWAFGQKDQVYVFNDAQIDAISERVFPKVVEKFKKFSQA
jgi:hypothetical protein